MLRLANSHFTVEIAERGAELRAIRDAEGGAWLSDGDPKWWNGISPLLFPVIGRSLGDAVTIAGKSYPMAAHGFARSSAFAVVSQTQTEALLRLEASEASRASFPFAFRLDVAYRLAGTTLHTLSTVTNLDNSVMPFQFGYHPAFTWPLPGNEGLVHKLRLGNGAEPALHRLDPDKMLGPDPLPSPFKAGELVVQPAMFEDDAMIFPDGVGRDVTFYAEGGSRLDMRTSNLPNFAVWQKAGAPFLCLEPWRGTSPLSGASMALETRHGGTSLAPGEAMAFGMDVTMVRG